jgi:hypothetical protein
LLRLVWQAFKAFASFSALVNTFGFTGGSGTTFPGPENVALAGVPNTGGAGGVP